MGTVPGMLLTVPYTAVQFVALQQCKDTAAKMGWEGARVNAVHAPVCSVVPTARHCTAVNSVCFICDQHLMHLRQASMPAAGSRNMRTTATTSWHSSCMNGTCTNHCLVGNYLAAAGKSSTVVSFASGAVAGAAATVASYPFDLLRTTLAAQGEPKVRTDRVLCRAVPCCACVCSCTAPPNLKHTALRIGIDNMLLRSSACLLLPRPPWPPASAVIRCIEACLTQAGPFTGSTACRGCTGASG